MAKPLPGLSMLGTLSLEAFKDWELADLSFVVGSLRSVSPLFQGSDRGYLNSL